jgi:hypothetical protein
MKKIIGFFIVMLSCLLMSAQQSDTSYHLLWYKGKKIKANVLLTASYDTVNYNPDKGVIKVTGKNGSGKQYDSMLKELNRSQQRTVEMVKRLAKGFPQAGISELTYNVRNAFDEVTENYTSLLSNEFTMPVCHWPALNAAAGRGPFLPEEYLDDPYDITVKELQDYMAGHRTEKITAVPVPPRLEFNYCYSCATEKRAAYKHDMNYFLAELRGDDEVILQKALSLSRQVQLEASEDRSVEIQKTVSMVIKFVFDRMLLKVRLLEEKYMDDPERCGAVLQVALSVNRQNQLLGSEDNLPSDFLIHAFTTLANYLEKALREEDYGIALNIQLLLSTERQFQLLGETMPGGLFARALKFNQFKLNMNVSAKVSGDGGYLLAQVKGDNWFSAFPDTTCHLRWILVGPYLNKTKVELLAAEMKGSGGSIPYVGTKTWNSGIPTLKVDFCKNEDVTDSIIAYPFHPEDFKELWNFPVMGATNVAQVNNVLVNCFIDVKRVKKQAEEFEDPAAVRKLQNEMLAQYQQMMKNYKSGNMIPSKNISLADLNSMSTAQANSNKISELIHSVNPGKYIFTPSINNRAKQVLKESLNGKEIFPENTATEYAWFHLLLEHDPNGPYHFN